MANKQGIQATKKEDAIQYGVRGSKKDTIQYGVRGSGSSIKYGIYKPSSDFDRRGDIGHSSETNPNP